MDVTDMVSDIQNNRGFDDISNSDIVAMINDTYHELLSSQPWPFMEKRLVGSTIQGDDAAPFSSATDIRALVKVIDTTNGYVLTRIRWDDLLSTYVSSLDATGVPLWVYAIGEDWHVYPIPDAVYNLYIAYLQTPADLVETSVTADILIPSRHQRILLHGTLARLYQLNDDSEASVFHQNEFDRRVTRMQNDVWMRDYSTPERVRDIYELTE